MVEVRMRQQHEINRRQMFDLETRTLDPFQQENQFAKFGSTRTYSHEIESENESVADPGEGDFVLTSTSERQAVYARRCARQQGLPNISRKSARVEMLRGR